jgi:hypothetical protein
MPSLLFYGKLIQTTIICRAGKTLTASLGSWGICIVQNKQLLGMIKSLLDLQSFVAGKRLNCYMPHCTEILFAFGKDRDCS